MVSLESFWQELPSFVLGGLFLSWLIWAYFFNDRSFKFEGKIEKIFVLLKIFFTLFAAIGGWLFVVNIVLLNVMKTDINRAVQFFTDFPNHLLILFLILTFAFVVMINEWKEATKEDLKIIFFQLNFGISILPVFLLGAAIASYFSSYKNFITMPIIASFLYSIIVIWFVGWLGSKLFDVDLKGHITKDIKENRGIFSLHFVFVLIFCLILSFIISFTMTPQSSVYETDSYYIVFDEDDVYLKKEIHHDIKDIGSSIRPTDWFPLFYGEFNKSTLGHRLLKELSFVEFNYEDDSSRDIDLSSLFDEDNPHPLLVGIDKNNLALLLDTHNKDFINQSLKNITFSYAIQVDNDDEEVVDIKPIQLVKQGHVKTISVRIEKPDNTPTLYDSIEIDRLKGILEDSQYCNLTKMSYEIKVSENQIIRGTGKCSDNDCRFGGRKEIVRGVISKEETKTSSRIELYIKKPFVHENMKFLIDLSC